MKGIVFTEFFEMIEETFGLDMVDLLIEKTELPSGGVYTAVGTYSHTEIVSLVINLSKETGMEVNALLLAFGKHLYKALTKAYPVYLEGIDHPFDMLESVETKIHIEVVKLYPDAELPSFHCTRISENQLEMVYTSVRHFEDLCEGLIRGCLEQFNHATADVKRESLPDESERFTISLSV